VSRRLRVGIACPYTWDVPGGVQAHVHDLADHLIALGHTVSVLTPVDDPEGADLPAYVVPAGRAVRHEFPDSLQAYWVRCTADRPCRATAWLIYE